MTAMADDNATSLDDVSQTAPNRSMHSMDNTVQARTVDLEKTHLYKADYQFQTEVLAPSDAWLRALDALDACDYELAYRTILDSGDDLFLLRLMYKTGPDCYRLLNEATSLRVFSRVVAIAKSQFLNDTILDFFFEACDSGMASQLDKETIESMIIVLECISPSMAENPIMVIVMDYLKSVKDHNYNAL
jgi:hypothetical protein